MMPVAASSLVSSTIDLHRLSSSAVNHFITIATSTLMITILVTLAVAVWWVIVAVVVAYPRSISAPN